MCFIVFFSLLVFAGHFVIYSTRFFSTLRLLPVLVFGKLFSGSLKINTHTIYQLGLEFFVFFLSLFSLLFVLFMFFVLSLAPFYRISQLVYQH